MRRWTGFALALSLSVASSAGVARAEEKAKSAVAFEDASTPFEAVLAKAKEAGKPVFLDFTSPT
jgi:hypothetical protein